MTESIEKRWQAHTETGRQALAVKQYDRAEEAYLAALRAAEHFGDDDHRLAGTLNGLARVYCARDNFFPAAALLHRLVAIKERAMGEKHAQVAGVITNLAEMYARLGDTRQELTLRERALEIRVHNGETDNTALAKGHERIAQLRRRLDGLGTPESASSVRAEPPGRRPEPFRPSPSFPEPVRSEHAWGDTPRSAPPKPDRSHGEPAWTATSHASAPAGSAAGAAPWAGAAAVPSPTEDDRPAPTPLAPRLADHGATGAEPASFEFSSMPRLGAVPRLATFGGAALAALVLIGWLVAGRGDREAQAASAAATTIATADSVPRAPTVSAEEAAQIQQAYLYTQQDGGRAVKAADAQVDRATREESSGRVRVPSAEPSAERSEAQASASKLPTVQLSGLEAATQAIETGTRARLDSANSNALASVKAPTWVRPTKIRRER